MSGIYIPKMKLPRNCGECPFFVDDGEFPFVEDGTWCGRVNYLICDGKIDRDSKPEWCDLIPVPDHGDLIDRDALEKDIDNYIGGEESRSRFHHWVQVQDAVIPMDKEKEK